MAGYFVDKGYEVYVLNRGSREQVPGVKLIQADRHDLRDKLSGYDFKPKNTEKNKLKIDQIVVVNPTMTDKLLTIKFKQRYKRFYFN